MYLIRDNPKQVLQQGTDNEWMYKGYINKMHKWYSADDDDQSIDEPTITYNVSACRIRKRPKKGIVDRGANGMVASDDCVWIRGLDGPKRYVAITGIDNHQIPSVPIGTVGAYAMSNHGPGIMIFNETAYAGRHPSIFSSN